MTTAENFPGGCTYNWVNSKPSIGLAAKGTGNISSFKALNNGKNPVTATIMATPVSSGYGYIANLTSNDVSVISTATNSLIATIKVGQQPISVSVSSDGRYAYIANSGSNSISVINTASNSVTATIPVGSSPQGIVVSPDGSNLYVVNSNQVSIFNTATNVLSSSITVGTGLQGISVSPDGSRIYVTNSGNFVTVINTSTGAIVSNIPVGANAYTSAVSPDGKLACTTNQNSHNISLINTQTNMATATIPVGVTPAAAVFSSNGTLVYITDPTTQTIYVINTTTNAIKSTINIPTSPQGISISPDGSRLYVTDRGNLVWVINTTTNNVVAKITVGSYPVSVGNFITPYLACNGSPITFAITVNPLPVITASAATGNIVSCQGTVSNNPNVQQFTVSGNNLTGDILVDAPSSFKLSINGTDGYGSTLTLPVTNGTVSNIIIYVRSSATAPVGNISGKVVLSSTNVRNQSIAVSGFINATPIVNRPGSQSRVNGKATTPIDFTGVADTFSWTNDMPGIGLAAKGTGNIPSFTTKNNTLGPVTATITVTPLNNTSCSGTPTEFTITVDPSPASVAAEGTLTPVRTIYGSPSPVNRFTVSGISISSGILITPPAGFEVSPDEKNFSPTITINGTGIIPTTAVFIRLAPSTHVGSYSGNVIVSANNASDATVMVPLSTVTRASITITADDKTRLFGVANPPLTVTYKGFVNGDGPDQLTALPTITTDATISSAVGQYAINVANDAASPDYMFQYNPGTLTITPLLSMLFIPNTFTPNGDGINDIWVIKDLEYYPKSTVNIFNRWGQKVFTSIGYPIPWNGTYQGKALPTGTYYYIIDAKNGQAMITGWVAIIR